MLMTQTQRTVSAVNDSPTVQSSLQCSNIYGFLKEGISIDSCRIDQLIWLYSILRDSMNYDCCTTLTRVESRSLHTIQCQLFKSRRLTMQV